MADILRWLLFFGIIAIGWILSQHHREAARKIARWLPVGAGVVLLCLVVTGFAHERDLAEFHRWTGHAFTIIIWLTLPFAVGVLLQHSLRQRPVVAIGQLLALLLLLGMGVLTGMTGYLGPSHMDIVDEAALNRFHVWHRFVLPGVTALLLVEWWWFFSRGAENGREPR